MSYTMHIRYHQVSQSIKRLAQNKPRIQEGQLFQDSLYFLAFDHGFMTFRWLLEAPGASHIPAMPKL